MRDRGEEGIGKGIGTEDKNRIERCDEENEEEEEENRENCPTCGIIQEPMNKPSLNAK